MQGSKYTPFRARLIAMIFALLCLLPMTAWADVAADSATAVVFVYQRVDEDSALDANISIDQFELHIKELKQGGYNVLPLGQIMDALKSGKDLPPKTVAITFDGAYQATMAAAVPRLTAANLPFTVFFAGDMADGGTPTHMNWSQLKKLGKNKLADFGILPASYANMVNLPAEENAALINRAVSKYRDTFGSMPQYFAYPYGEYDAALRKQLAGYGFKGVFGQHSGVIHSKSDFLALPRFTMTGDYGDLDRFILTARALPLPVQDIVPDNTIVRENPPHIGFTVTPEITNISKLACFASNVGKLTLLRLGGNRIELRPEQPFVDRRTRVNCTLVDSAVTPGEPRRWRWFGLMFLLPDQANDADEVESTENAGG